jgi:molybdopterin converting factor small subunit
MPHSGVPEIIVEFYALARRRAGLNEMPLRAATVAEAVHEITRRCPRLRELFLQKPNGPSVLISLNAGPFLTDWNTTLSDGDRLVILSADAGG